MNQFSFKPRALLLATAFAAASIVNAQTTESTPASAPATDSSAADITSMDRTILAASGSASHSTKATKSKPAKSDQHVASATRTNSRTPNKNAAIANPADSAYREELRNCVQMQGDQRNSCLDRAIEHHATS